MRSLLLALVCSTLACSDGLDLPSREPCAGAACRARPCADLTTQADCEARSGCYAIMSYGELCNGISCESHFASCAVGPVDCHVPVTCTIASVPGYCPSGYTAIVPAGGCLSECVRSSLCSACGAHGDEASCEADGACHARFDDGPCAESPCPPTFTSCEDGPAQCTPGSPSPDDCASTLETCDTDDNYVPGYLGDGCPDGCVRAQDCPLSDGE